MLCSSPYWHSLVGTGVARKSRGKSLSCLSVQWGHQLLCPGVYCGWFSVPGTLECMFPSMCMDGVWPTTSWCHKPGWLLIINLFLYSFIYWDKFLLCSLDLFGTHYIRSGWPWDHKRSTCLCLLSAGNKGTTWYHAWPGNLTSKTPFSLSNTISPN